MINSQIGPQENKHPQKQIVNNPIILAQKFKNVYMSYTIRINYPTSVDAQFTYAQPDIIDKLTDAILIDDAIKLQLQLKSTLHKARDKRYKTSGYFKTKATEVTWSDDLDKVLAELFQNIKFANW